MPRFDPQAHRELKNYPSSTLMRRVIWSGVSLALRLIPRHCYRLRNSVLRLMGAKIGKNVRIYPSATIFYPWNLEVADEVTIAWDVRLYTLAPIRIASGSILSQGAHLCSGTHDLNDAARPLLLRPIHISERCWIAADAFIGPGVTIGADCVVGARSVVMKDVENNRVVAGNPAQVIRVIDHPG